MSRLSLPVAFVCLFFMLPNSFQGLEDASSIMRVGTNMPLPRNTSWLISGKNLYSRAYGYQTCDLSSSESSLCFLSENIRIDCRIDTVFTQFLLSEVNITFTYENQTEFLNYGGRSMHVTLSELELSKNINGLKWLEIIANKTSSYMIVVMDYISRVTIMVEEMKGTDSNGFVYNLMVNIYNIYNYFKSKLSKN